MKTFALAVLALGASAWSTADYAAHQKDLGTYKPIERIQLGNHSDHDFEYGPDYTADNGAGTDNDRTGWNKQYSRRALNRYTHAHHGDDAEDTMPTDDHEYAEEHAHFNEIYYKDRHDVIIDQPNKTYTVTPVRYYRSKKVDAADEDEDYVEDIFFPSAKDETVFTDKHTASFKKFRKKN